MDKYIGLDMDSNKTVACVIESGKKDMYQTLGPDIASLRRFLHQQRCGGVKTHVVFEISGQAGFIYDSIIDCADSVTVANPSKMTWIYRTAKKTDRVDARKMAVLLGIGEIPAVYMPSVQVRQWRQSILHRRTIVGKITAVKNRIRAMLKSRGYDKAAYRGSWWKVLNRQWMRQRADTTDLWCVGLTNLLDELELHEKQLATITKYLDSYLEKRADAKLVMTIPGIGPRTSEAVLAYTDDIHRFSTSKRYRSYFGVVPKIDQSGNNFRMGHISKQGPSVVRWLLCESSWKAVRKSPALKAFYERICNGDVRRKKIAMVAVCRKILCIMRAMLLTGELFNELLVTKLCKEDTEAA